MAIGMMGILTPKARRRASTCWALEASMEVVEGLTEGVGNPVGSKGKHKCCRVGVLGMHELSRGGELLEGPTNLQKKAKLLPTSFLCLVSPSKLRRTCQRLGGRASTCWTLEASTKIVEGVLARHGGSDNKEEGASNPVEFEGKHKSCRGVLALYGGYYCWLLTEQLSAKQIGDMADVSPGVSSRLSDMFVQGPPAALELIPFDQANCPWILESGRITSSMVSSIGFGKHNTAITVSEVRIDLPNNLPGWSLLCRVSPIKWSRVSILRKVAKLIKWLSILGSFIGQIETSPSIKLCARGGSASHRCRDLKLRHINSQGMSMAIRSVVWDLHKMINSTKQCQVFLDNAGKAILFPLVVELTVVMMVEAAFGTPQLSPTPFLWLARFCATMKISFILISSFTRVDIKLTSLTLEEPSSGAIAMLHPIFGIPLSIAFSSANGLDANYCQNIFFYNNPHYAISLTFWKEVMGNSANFFSLALALPTNSCIFLLPRANIALREATHSLGLVITLTVLLPTPEGLSPQYFSISHCYRFDNSEQMSVLLDVSQPILNKQSIARSSSSNSSTLKMSTVVDPAIGLPSDLVVMDRSDTSMAGKINSFISPSTSLVRPGSHSLPL
eukprot:Gb_34105 [translate_table: standard]